MRLVAFHHKPSHTVEPVGHLPPQSYLLIKRELPIGLRLCTIRGMPPKATENRAAAPPVEIPLSAAVEGAAPFINESNFAMPEGGITEHKNRYGDNPLDCPFLNSMGAAGIKLAEQLEVAQHDPNRGKTIGEILAERAQQKAQQEKPTPVLPEIEFTVTEPTEPTKEIAKKLEEIYIRENQKEIIPAQEIVIDTELPLSISKKADARAFAPSVLQVKLPIQEASVIAEETVIPHTPAVKASLLPRPQLELSQPTIIPEAATITESVITKDVTELSLREIPIAVPEVPELILTPEDISIALPQAVEQDIETIIQEVAAATEQFREQPLQEAEIPVVDITTIEEIFQDWLQEDELDIIETVPPARALDEILPITEPETKVQVVAVLENVVQVLHEISSGEISVEVATEQIQELTKELFELFGLEPNKEAVARVVQDIILSSRTVNKDTAEFSNDIGTHEIKKSLAHTVQLHVAHALHKRLARLKELSRYIIDRLAGSVFVTSPVGQV